MKMVEAKSSVRRVPTQLAFTPLRIKTLENIKNDMIEDGLIDEGWEERWKTKLWVIYFVTRIEFLILYFKTIV